MTASKIRALTTTVEIDFAPLLEAVREDKAKTKYHTL